MESIIKYVFEKGGLYKSLLSFLIASIVFFLVHGYPNLDKIELVYFIIYFTISFLLLSLISYIYKTIKDIIDDKKLDKNWKKQVKDFWEEQSSDNQRMILYIYGSMNKSVGKSNVGYFDSKQKYFDDVYSFLTLLPTKKIKYCGYFLVENEIIKVSNQLGVLKITFDEELCKIIDKTIQNEYSRNRRKSI